MAVEDRILASDVDEYGQWQKKEDYSECEKCREVIRTRERVIRDQYAGTEMEIHSYEHDRNKDSMFYLRCYFSLADVRRCSTIQSRIHGWT
jgi:hypothetical protein